MYINHSDYISIPGKILISFQGNSLEPLVVFEQVYWTCLRMTDPFQSDVDCRYPLKLFNITLTAYPSHPVRQVHDPMVETGVPKEAEAARTMQVCNCRASKTIYAFQYIFILILDDLGVPPF